MFVASVPVLDDRLVPTVPVLPVVGAVGDAVARRPIVAVLGEEVVAHQDADRLVLDVRRLLVPDVERAAGARLPVLPVPLRVRSAVAHRRRRRRRRSNRAADRPVHRRRLLPALRRRPRLRQLADVGYVAGFLVDGRRATAIRVDDRRFFARSTAFRVERRLRSVDDRFRIAGNDVEARRSHHFVAAERRGEGTDVDLLATSCMQTGNCFHFARIALFT